MNEMLTASKVVTSAGVHTPGWVRVADGVITGVGSGRPSGATRDIGDAILVPGFVDPHVHGGGGNGFSDGTRIAVLAARDAHLARGTTTTMASLVAASPSDLLEQVRSLTPLVLSGELRGIHLEGPWLNPERKGAHDVAALRTPDPREIDTLLEAGRGAIRMVTIAPELPGALAAIEQFVAAEVIVAIGHTNANFEQTRLAIDVGATVATHLFNAMPPLLHREPGPVLALLEDERVTLELVADGVHLHPSLVDWVERSVGTSRVMFVTDAMSGAGLGDGAYRLGDLSVSVQDGVARIEGTETIAGSTATMDQLFRGRAILVESLAGTSLVTERGEGGVDPITFEATSVPASPRFSDESLTAAVKLTATNAAHVMGWDNVGDIAVGKRADFVVLGPDLQLRGVDLAETSTQSR